MVRFLFDTRTWPLDSDSSFTIIEQIEGSSYVNPVCAGNWVLKLSKQAAASGRSMRIFELVVSQSRKFAAMTALLLQGAIFKFVFSYRTVKND